MPKTTGPIRIMSEGDSSSSFVIMPDGRLLEGVTSVTIYMEPNEVTRADITIIAPIVEVKTVPGTTYLFCTICEQEHDHDCKPTTLGGV